MVKEKVREILIKNYRNKAYLIDKLSDDEDFVKMGLFDSFELINIVLLIQAEFKVKIEVADWARESINSLEKIATFVALKKGQA